jgi:hypothetical protein
MQVASASYQRRFLFTTECRKGEPMHPSSRFRSKLAAFVASLLLVGALAGSAAAQEAKPPAPAAVPQVHKMTIYNGTTPTVTYSVEGVSPHLEALAQTLEFTENELTLTKELQKLRIGMVVNEQTLDSIRTSQALGLGPISTPGYADGCAPTDSALKRALIPGLAREATPATAFQLINLREQVQTQLQGELKKAVPAMPGAPQAMQNAQPAAPMAGPVAAPQVTVSVQAAPKRASTPPAPVAAPTLSSAYLGLLSRASDARGLAQSAMYGGALSSLLESSLK